jgi:hypothetical protein
MKLLKIEGDAACFRNAEGGFTPVSELTRDGLMMLVGWALEEDDVDLDEYNEMAIKNHSHQIIYKHVWLKLKELRGKRDQFKDQADRLFLSEYERYRGTATKVAAKHESKAAGDAI